MVILKEYEFQKKCKILNYKKGIERKKLLNIWYLKDAKKLYNSAKENVKNIKKYFFKFI